MILNATLKILRVNTRLTFNPAQLDSMENYKLHFSSNLSPSGAEVRNQSLPSCPVLDRSSLLPPTKPPAAYCSTLEVISVSTFFNTWTVRDFLAEIDITFSDSINQTIIYGLNLSSLGQNIS